MTKKISKVLFLVAIISVSFFATSAQNEKKEKKDYNDAFTFGPRLAVNFSNEFLSKTFKADFAPGADFGLFFRISLPARLYLQPEVNYSIRNSKFNNLDDLLDSFDDSFKHKSHLIDIPILLGYKIVKSKIFNLRIFIGPEIGIRIDDNIKAITTKNFTDNFNFGFQGGLGIDIWRFTIDAGYVYQAAKNKPEIAAIAGKKYSQENMFKIGIGFKCY